MSTTQKTDLKLNPKIEQIKLGGVLYDINSKKDWLENNQDAVSFIHNRTHYDTTISGAELLAEGASAAHSFANGFVKQGTNYLQNYIDLWVPIEDWIYADKKYDIIITYIGKDLQTEVEQKNTVTLPASPNSGPTLVVEQQELGPGEIEGWKVYFDPDTRVFSVQGETCDPNTVRTKYFRLELKPCDTEEYTKTKALDPKYIPIDHKTIGVNPEGKLEANSVFNEDFIVTETFGKYEVINGKPVIVPAKGKDMKDVITDAFCTDICNSSKLNPSADLTVSLDPTGSVEIGTSVTCTASLAFINDSYDYPMLDTHNANAVTNLKSNLEATGYTLKFTGAVIEESNTQSHKTQPIELDEAKKYTFIVDGTIKYSADDRYIPGTMLGKEDIVVKRNKGETPATALTKKLTITSQYNYFIVYNKPDNTLNYDTVYNNGNFDRNLSEALTKYKLAAFEPELTTTKLQQIYFLAPKGKVSKIALKNATTTASAGTVIGPEAIMVEDAGKKLHEYELFYINNAEADSGTNKYKVEVIK